jgi:ABC-type phosphate transport system substrate-binding protein
MRIHRALIGVLLAMAIAGSAAAGDLAVIVHPERDVRLDVDEIAQIYLRIRRFWEGGERILPVNRSSGAPARRAFERLVFGADARDRVVYWNRRYYEGVLPPATLASDEAVKRFVASERLAIGYVDASLVDDSVRVVLRLHDP